MKHVSKDDISWFQPLVLFGKHIFRHLSFYYLDISFRVSSGTVVKCTEKKNSNIAHLNFSELGLFLFDHVLDLTTLERPEHGLKNQIGQRIEKETLGSLIQQSR